MQKLDSKYKQRMQGHHDALGPLRALPKDRTSLGRVWARSSQSDVPACVYVHIPFCSRLCRFCNLRRQVGEPPQDYSQSILEQMKLFSRLPGIERMAINAIYFGGGTPTVLPPADLGAIISGLKGLFSIDKGVEITIETSLSDLTDEHLHMFATEGVNRVSLGVQTFATRGRNLLGRKGSSEDSISRIKQILDSGLDNVSLDLIYNYPGQTLDELRHDLQCITDLNISGLSIYPLMLHEGSTIFREIKEGRLEEPREVAEEKRLFEVIFDHLSSHGFEILELTKMVRPGRDHYQYIRTRYGGGSTLAFGAGAAGKIGRFAYHNPLTIDDYRAQNHRPVEDLPGFCKSAYEEQVYRLIGRVQMGIFPGKDYWPAAEAWLGPLRKELLDAGLLQQDAKGVCLSKTGLFWGNNIAREIGTCAVTQKMKE